MGVVSMRACEKGRGKRRHRTDRTSTVRAGGREKRRIGGEGGKEEGGRRKPGSPWWPGGHGRMHIREKEGTAQQTDRGR